MTDQLTDNEVLAAFDGYIVKWHSNCPDCFKGSLCQQVAILLPEKSKTTRVKCNCSCHRNPGVKHVVECCDNGWIEIEAPENGQQPIGQYNLLPCPFCGSQPEWINEVLADSHFYIKCQNCHIIMKEDRRDKVIGMWNNRKQSSGNSEQLEDQEKIFDMLFCQYFDIIKADRSMKSAVKELMEQFIITRKQ